MGKSKKDKKKSIKKAFYLYITVMFAAVLLLSGTAVKICVTVREEILASHAFIYDPQFGQAGGEEQDFSHAFIYDPRFGQADGESVQEFTQRDQLFCRILEILTILLPFFFLCMGIWVAGSVFYSRKLKKPFHLLKQGMEHIEQGDLDFSLGYDVENCLPEAGHFGTSDGKPTADDIRTTNGKPGRRGKKFTKRMSWKTCAVHLRRCVRVF